MSEWTKKTALYGGVCIRVFSTKYTDDDTGLVYYGYRDYSTSLGRWINRDPMGEDGGLNLYCFILNSSISRYDILGKFSPQYHEEIIKNAYRREIKEEYLQKLINQDAMVDISLQFKGGYHYDNNDIKAGNEVIESTFSEIEKLEKESHFNSFESFEMTVLIALDMEHFAGITHASADYWAHTNAIELELLPGLQERTGIISGYFALSDHLKPMDNSSYYSQITTSSGEIKNLYNLVWMKKFTHTQLNKDNPTTPEGSVWLNGRLLHKWAKLKASSTIEERLKTFKSKAPCIWAYIKK